MTRLAVALLVALAGCDDDNAPADQGVFDLQVADSAPSDGGGGPSAARGEYLVRHLLVCGDCHSTPTAQGLPDPTKFLAGGRAFSIPGAGPDGGVGVVYAANLTNDATGLAAWTESNIVDALTVGVDKDGIPLWPIMPYYMFGNLTMDDAQSIAMYIKSVPSIANTVPMNTAPQPPQAAPRVDDTMIPHTTLPSSDPQYGAAVRGRYLAKVACIECHTERNPPGSSSVLNLAKAFAGGQHFPLGFLETISANLTPHATGLASFSAGDIAATLRTDQEKGTGRPLCPPMPGGPGRLGDLVDGDLADIAAFVHTLPPVSNGPFGCTDAGVPYGLDGGTR